MPSPREADAIPAAVWRREHHARIFRSAGPCTRCTMRDRDGVTSCCNAPMCATCLAEHKRESCEEREMQDDFTPDPDDTEPIL